MLVITRKVGTEIVIGDDIHVTVLSVRGNSIRLGVDAPRSTPVHRREVHERKRAASQPKITQRPQSAPGERQEATAGISTRRAAN